MAGNEDLVENIDKVNVNENQENVIDNVETLDGLKNQNIILSNDNINVETDVKLIDIEDDIKDSNLCAVDSSDQLLINTCDEHKDVNTSFKINENDDNLNEHSLISQNTETTDSSCDENKYNTEGSFISRTKPVVHTPAEKPLCQKHASISNQLIKIDCDDCFSLLTNPSTSISQIFGAMREWMPGSQKKMNVLVDEILKRGAHIDDMDGLEGNTMLHYACKSASEGIGSSEMAKELVKDLIAKGANFKLRSRWTDMLPLHFAAYFNCPDVLEVLLDASSNTESKIPTLLVTRKTSFGSSYKTRRILSSRVDVRDIDARCKEYDQGTALHMAASGLCYNAAKFLVERGSDPTLINNKFKTPYECVAEGTKQELRQTPDSVERLKSLLKSAKSPVADEVLKEIGVSLGEDVLVGGEKTGTLRFCGRTQFASGVWCGVELHDKTGKNNGSVAGVTYFKSKPGHGMFAPPSKLSVLGKQRRTSQSSTSSDSAKLKVGDRVNVIGFKLGYIRFLGKVRFAGGVWAGVELDKPYGKCNGTKDGVKYFSCRPQHGVLVPLEKVKRSEAAGRSEKDSLMSPKISRVTTSRTVGSPSSGNMFDTNRAPVCASPMRAAPLNTSTPAASPAARGLPSTPATAGLSSPTMRSRGLRSPGIVRSNSGSSRGTSPNRSASNETVYKKQIKLQPGMNAFVNGELGTVKYVGRVEFAEGIWVGLHLKNQNGKNDGTVQGKRYFSCKQGYGIMVRPSKVTIHGIAASKLIDEKDYPE